MGNKAVAPPNSTANKSSEIEPRMLGLSRTKRTPANNDDSVGASGGRTGLSMRMAPLKTLAKIQNTAVNR